MTPIRFVAIYLAIIGTLCMGTSCPPKKDGTKAGATPPANTGKLPAKIDDAGTNAAMALVALDKKYAALQAEHEALKKSSAVAAAQVGSANIGNTNNPPGPAREVVHRETSMAMTNLPPADLVEALAAAKRRTALLEGRVAEAEALYKVAQTESEQMKAERAKLKADTDKASQEAELQRQKAAAAQAALVEAEKRQAAELKANEAANQAKLDAANRKAEEEIKKVHDAWNVRLVWICVGIGSLCILAGVGMLIATNGASAWRSGIAFVCGAICFGFAKLLSHPMFTTYFTIGCVLVVIAVLVFLWRERVHTRETKELAAAKAEQEEQLRKKEKTLRHVVSAVEEVRNSDPAANALLTERLDYHTSPDSTRPEYVKLKSEVTA